MIDLELLKKIYNLTGKEVEWGVIEYTFEDKTDYKLGLIILGSRLCVDLVGRRFYTLWDSKVLKIKIYLADVEEEDSMVAFVAKEDSSKQVVKPSSILDDVYSRAWYHNELENVALL